MIDFTIDGKDEKIRILKWEGDNKCRPATECECALWDELIDVITRLQKAEIELSALSDFLYTVERASDKGNLPHWMQDDYDSYVSAMKSGT